METIIFEKDETVKALTLDELKKTCSITDAGGKLPQSRPLDHYQFIEEVQERLDKANLAYEMDPIWVAKSDSGRIPKLDPEKQGNIESWVFPRLVTRFQLLFGSNEKYNPAIAIGYNIKGLTLAVGTNTRICSNQSIFGNSLMQTWGKSGVAFEKIFNVFNDWLSKYDEKFAKDVKFLDTMEQFQINCSDAQQMIGELHIEAAKNAYVQQSVEAPFNVSQMTKLSTNLYNKHLSKSDELTLSDFYNVGTDLLKPKTTDIVDIWANNNMFSDYIVNKFNLHNLN